MPVCYPSETDWSCSFTAEQLEEMRADTAKAAAMARSEAFGWYTLAALTGYQIGVCPVLIRPCAARCAPAGTWMAAPVAGGNAGALPLRSIGSFTPYITGGQWVNGCGCGTPSSCGCGRVEEVLLPGPVGAIEYVKIDGVTVDPSRYRVDDGARLVATDPTLRWPLCQDVAASENEPGAFVVSYYQGAAPDEMTRLAAGMLAAEFYRACTGNGKCKLPTGVKTLVRQGVTFEIEDGMFANGLTGILEVDSLIRIYNPNGLKSAPVVTSPDAGARGRRQTWGAY